jgi:outer membrane protein
MTSRSLVLIPVTLTLLLGQLAAAQIAPAQTTPAQTSPAPTAPAAPAPAQPAPAQTVAPAVQVPLRDYLGRLTQAPGWRSAALQYLSASQNLDAARARAGLSVSAGADVNAVKAPFDSGELSASTALSVQAAINVLPWSPAQDSVRQAARGVYRAGLDQRDAQNALAVSVVQGYLTASQGAASLAAAQAQQALTARQLEVARAQQQSGVLSQEGLQAAQAAQEQAAAAVAEAGSTLDIALRQLDNTLGVTSAPAPVTAAPAFGSRPAVPAAPGPLEGYLQRASGGRSEILKALSNQQDAQTALDAARLDRTLPSVSVSAQYGQLAGSTGTAGRSVGGSLNFKTGALSGSASLPLKQATTPQGDALPSSLALGLSASYVILNPAGDVAVQSAQTSLNAAALSLASARAGVDLDVRQKYAGLQNALLALTAPRTLLSRAQTALASTQARAQAGLATTLDVQQAQLGVLQAQNTLSTATNAAYLASLSLSVATAEFTPSLIAVPDAMLPEVAAPEAARPEFSQPNAAHPNPVHSGGLS